MATGRDHGGGSEASNARDTPAVAANSGLWPSMVRLARRLLMGSVLARNETESTAGFGHTRASTENAMNRRKHWTELVRDSRGATMVEYIVIVALILIVALEAWQRLGENVNTKTGEAADALQ